MQSLVKTLIRMTTQSEDFTEGDKNPAHYLLRWLIYAPSKHTGQASFKQYALPF